MRRRRSRWVRDRSRARIAPAPSAVWRFRRISRDCASFSGGLAMAGFLQASCSHYPFVLFCIYTIALYDYYPITLYHFYLIVSREDWIRSWLGGFNECYCDVTAKVVATPLPHRSFPIVRHHLIELSAPLSTSLLNVPTYICYALFTIISLGRVVPLANIACMTRHDFVIGSVILRSRFTRDDVLDCEVHPDIEISPTVETAILTFTPVASVNLPIYSRHVCIHLFHLL